jgi:hypothetical protein
MSPWALLTVCFVAPLVGGCATTIEPGLANAPRLGGSQASDLRIHDVVSNGADSCGRHAEHGPLRARIPPCPTAGHPVVGTVLFTESPDTESLVLPWLEHFYADWPCSTAGPLSRPDSAATHGRGARAPALSAGVSTPNPVVPISTPGWTLPARMTRVLASVCTSGD